MNSGKKIDIYSVLWHILPFLGFAVWGALCITNNLWYDEGYTAALISRPLKELIQITAQDVHAPFYYILLKAFHTLCGGGTRFWPLKLFSLLFMTAYLFLGKYGVRKLFDQQTSVFFMLFSLLMPGLCVQAGNARMYAMGLFFFTAAGLLACDILRESSWKKWVLFCLCSIGSVYSHTFAMIETFLLYLILLGVLLYRKKFSLLKWYLGSGLTVAACYMPWLLVIYQQMQSRIAAQGTGEEIPTMYTFIDYCRDWFSATDSPITPVIYLGMALTLFLGYYAVDGMRREKCFIPAWGLGILGLTTLTGCLLSLYVTPCFMGRYIFAGFGALALWYAVGMRQIAGTKIRAAVIWVFLLCFALQYRSELQLEYDRGMQEYENFYENNIRPEDLVMAMDIHSLYLSIYHPEQQSMIYGYMPPFSPFRDTAVFNEWEQLWEVTGDIWLYTLAGRDLPDFFPYYDMEPAFQFHYMYYDFVIYRLVPVEPSPSARLCPFPDRGRAYTGSSYL